MDFTEKKYALTLQNVCAAGVHTSCARSVCLSFNPLTAKLFNWNFHPLEVVSR